MSEDPAPRRVLVLVDQYVDPYGGTEGQIRALLEGLPESWAAEMWVLQPSRWLEANEFPCPTRNLGLRALARPSTLVRMASLAREVRRRFDLVQTYMNDASIAGALIAAAAKVPCLVARRDLGFWQTPRVLHALHRTDRLTQGVIVNCEAVKAHTVAAEHVPPARVHVVANGHDPARFDVDPEPDLRKRLSIPPGAPLVGLLANIKPLKRHDDLLDALARLADSHPDVHALCIGEPVAPGQPLSVRARVRGLGARVHEILAPGNAIPLLRHLDVGVLCSETEGLSNALLEYMGCGLPVVATRVGGNVDLVEHEVNGYLYEPGDVDALAAHLDSLLDDPDLRRRMGEASRRRFRDRFTRDRMVDATTALWARAIDPPPAEPRAGSLAWGVVVQREGVEKIAEAWDALLRRGQVFLSPDWMLAWLEHGEPEARPHVITGWGADERLVGVLPLVDRGGVLGFPGQGEGADHLDVVAARGYEDTVARGTLGMAFHRDLGRRLRLLHLAEDGALRHALHRAARQVAFGEVRSTSCPYAAVDGRRWDDYVQAQFSYAARRNVRRYPRRFHKLEGATVERVTTPEEAARGIDRFLALHDRRFEGRDEASALADPRIRAFHRALATRMARRGRLALTFLRLGDRDVACEYGFRHAEKLYAFQSGFLEDAGFESPGVVLQAIVMEEDVFGEGLVEYDFLDGTEDYKRRWATGERRLYDVEVFGLTPAARALACTKGAIRLTYELLFRS